MIDSHVADGLAQLVLTMINCALFKGTLVLLCVGGAALALRGAAAALRHLLWTVGIACLFLLPVAAGIMPDWHVSVPSRFPLPGGEWRSASTPAAQAVATTPTAGEPGTTRAMEAALAAPVRPAGRPWIALVWVAGALVMAARFVAAQGPLRRQASDSRALTDAEGAALAGPIAASLGIRRPVAVLISEHRFSPRSWGWLNPVIVLPETWREWSVVKRRAVLVHELSHIRRGDCATQALANLACILYWFHPFVWYAAERMRRERERACDDAVLKSGSRPSDYADQLLEIASSLGRRGRPAFLEVPMARSSQLSSRLLAILDPAIRRDPPGRGSGASVATVLVAFALVVSALETGAAPVPGAGASSSPRTVTLAEFQSAWRGIADEMLASARARDARRFAACYSRQAHLMAQGVPTIRGRDDIAELAPRMWATGFHDIDLRNLEFYRVGDAFCVVGDLSFLDDARHPVATARFMSLYVHEDGRWRIHRDIANS